MQEAELRRGPWFEEEDERLIAAVTVLGERRWDALAKASGLRRTGKSCRLRWMNYLRPNLKHGHITAEEEDLIIRLQKQLGNRWSRIARRLPGRTDNEIKNYWRSHLRKKALVLEQEHSNSTMNNCLQNPMVAIQEEASLSSSSGDCSSEKDDNLATSAECSDTLELSNLGIACSPYETRLTDWISNWSNEQCTTEHDVRYCHSNRSSDIMKLVSGMVHSPSGTWIRAEAVHL